MSDPTKQDRLDNVRLRNLAAEHGGIVPVPFVGARWVERGFGYWWRRIGGTIVYLLAVGLTAGGTVGLAIAFLTGTPVTVRVVVIVVAAALALLGGRTGMRQVRRLPVDDAEGPRVRNIGCLVVVVLPYAAGVCLVLLGAALRPQFLGETRARTASRAVVAGGPGRGKGR